MFKRFDQLKSLSSRILLVVLPAVIITLIVLFTLLSLQNYYSLRSELVRTLDELVSVQKTPVAEAVWEYDEERISNILNDLSIIPYIAGVIIHDDRGDVLGLYGDGDSTPSTDDFRIRTSLVHNTPIGEENVGELTITVTDALIRKEVFKSLFSNLIILVVTAGILILMITVIVRRQVSTPITRFARAAQELAAVDFSYAEAEVETLPLNRADEVGDLAKSFDYMVSALKEAYSSLEGKVEERTAELADQLAFQQALIDTMPTPLFFKDIETRLLGVNRAFEEMFNVRNSDIAGLRVEELKFLPEAARKEYQAEEYEVIRTRKAFTREVQLPLWDKKVHTFLLSISVFRKADGTTGGLVGTLVDITTQKEITRNLETAKESAEAATQAKANFLASMSHEIRTPLNGIIGMVDLLRQSELENEHREMLQTINESGQSLLRIINDILDFSKMEAGKLDMESISLSVLDVVEGPVETLRQTALKKDINLITYVDPALPEFVLGDPVRIRQILINLGGNAIKFTEKGTVMIRVDQVGRIENDSIILCFSVHDEGIGISQEAQKSLFQEFSQADVSTTRRFGGTGLGLSICQRLTEMMDGEIGVRSKPGEGSVFICRIPFKISDTHSANREVTDLQGLNVLLVGENEKEMFVCSQYLEYCNARVESVQDQGKSLERLKALQDEGKLPDVVILGSTWKREVLFAMRDKLAADEHFPELKFILLMHGRRTKARLGSDKQGTVILDVGPLKKHAFLTAVNVAVGRESPEVYREEDVENLKAGSAPSIEDALKENKLILVAEDNPVNRDVIKRQLEMLGYACELVEDGKKALTAWRDKNYAILLTDCHMPEMDGFELTAAIRNSGDKSKCTRPIIAITANALQGEAERCKAAGMDDYMSKPIDMKLLRDKLKQWLPQDENTKNYSKQSLEDIHDAKDIDVCTAIDINVLKEMFGDDDTVNEILNDFIEPTDRIKQEIKTGHENRDVIAVQQAAHKLKSSARSVGANSLADLCQLLESAGRESNWNTIDRNIEYLEPLMTEVMEFINNTCR